MEYVEASYNSAGELVISMTVIVLYQVFIGSNSMKYCCYAFECNVGEVGRRGLSILAVDKSGHQYFAIQGRSANYEENVNPEGVFQGGIQFCPWCGRKLKRFITKQLDEFKILAKNHSQFCI